MYQLKRNLDSYFPAYKFYPYITNYYISHIKFYSTQYHKKTTSISQPKQKIKSRTISFPQSNTQKEYYQFSSNKRNHRNRTTHFLRPKIPFIILIKKRITSATWAMSKSQSIYMWEHVDRIIQRIESRIDFNSKTTDLYNSQYCSKEYEDCSVQSYHFIIELVWLNKPLENGIGF